MAVESGQYAHLFGLAKHPISLWNERAKIPGLQSVMSLGKSEQVLEEEARITRDRLFLELGDLRTKSVLEVGTGIGRFTGDLAERASRVVSIDLSREMLKRAMQTNLDGAFLLQAAGQNLPLRDGSFDSVLESTVLIHIVDDDIFEILIAESMRVLKPGGQIVFCDPIASEKSVQKHPYLKHRVFSEYQDAAGVPLEDRGELKLSTNSVHFLIGTKPCNFAKASQ